MNSEQNHPARLKSTVEPLKGSVFRVRDPDDPNTFVLVHVEKEYCSCSLESNPDDIHIKKAKEYLKLKGRKEVQDWNKRS